MSELWVLALVPVLAWLLARVRVNKALQEAEEIVYVPEGVSSAEMGQVVRELTGQLNPPSRVTSPTLPTEAGHVWNSPTGKRVYMN